MSSDLSQVVYVRKAGNELQECSVSIPDDPSLTSIKQPLMVPVSFPVHVVNPNIKTTQQKEIPLDRIDSFLNQRTVFVCWTIVAIIVSALELLISWLSVVWIVFFSVSLCCIRNAKSTTCSFILSLLGNLVALPGSCLIIYLLYSMGSIYKYISYLIIPCVLLEGIYCIVMLVAWGKWIRIPRDLREYAYLYRKAIPIVK